MERLLSLIVAASLVLPTLAYGQVGLSTGELSALRPPAANRTARQDLLSIFEPVDQIRSGMFRQLQGIAMITRPYGVRFTGLCRRDTLWLRYAPTNTDAPLGRQPLQAYGVEAHAHYRALAVPKIEATGQDAALSVWRSDCDGLDGDQGSEPWFTAASDEDAAKAVNLLTAATDQIRAGGLKPGACSLFPTEKRSCEQTILDEGGIGKINSVEACASDAGSECYVVDVGVLTRLTIVGRVAPQGLAPASVNSITVDQYIVVS